MFELSLDLLHNTTIKKLSLTSNSKVIYSEINTQNFVLRTNVLLSGIDFFRERKYEECSSLPINSEETFADLPREIFFITSRDIKNEFLPLFEESKNELISFDACVSWKIISNTTVFDDWFGLAFFDYPACLFNTTNSQLTREIISTSSQGFVDERMEFNIVPDLFLPCNINTSLQTSLVSLDSLDYFSSGSNLYFGTNIRSHTQEGCFLYLNNFGFVQEEFAEKQEVTGFPHTTKVMCIQP